MSTTAPTLFTQATKNLMNRIDCNPNDREEIRQFLIEFAEHILGHTTPASGNTIKRLTTAEIALALPDMEAQSAWVIESENGFFIGETTYRKSGSGLGWVPCHENALRFARKEDAEAILRICISSFGIGLHENAKGVNEHIWYPD